MRMQCPTSPLRCIPNSCVQFSSVCKGSINSRAMNGIKMPKADRHSVMVSVTSLSKDPVIQQWSMYSLLKAVSASTVRPSSTKLVVKLWTVAAGEVSSGLKQSIASLPLTQPHQCTSWNEPKVQLLIHEQSKWNSASGHNLLRSGQWTRKADSLSSLRSCDNISRKHSASQDLDSLHVYLGVSVILSPGIAAVRYLAV